MVFTELCLGNTNILCLFLLRDGNRKKKLLYHFLALVFSGLFFLALIRSIDCFNAKLTNGILAVAIHNNSIK